MKNLTEEATLYYNFVKMEEKMCLVLFLFLLTGKKDFSILHFQGRYWVIELLAMGLGKLDTQGGLILYQLLQEEIKSHHKMLSQPTS